MLDLKQFKPQYVTNEAGEKTAIILPIASSKSCRSIAGFCRKVLFRALGVCNSLNSDIRFLDFAPEIELCDGTYCSAVVAERREEPTISHHQLVTELKQDDLI